MATSENNNDQNNNNFDPDMQLAFEKEKNRHEERVAEINASNAREDRKLNLEERKVASQEKVLEAQLTANKAEQETVNSARMTLLGIVEKGIEFLQDKVYPDYRQDKAQRWRFYEGLRAAREGIFVTFSADGSVSFTSAKVGVGIVMDTSATAAAK